MPPIAAVREGATLPKSRLLALRRRTSRWSRSSCSDPAARSAGSSSAAWRRGASCCCSASASSLLFIGVALISRARQAARPVLGWPARRVGGSAGAARPRERDAEPRPDGVDGRGADDRPGAGHLRRRPRARACAIRSTRRSTSRSAPTTSSRRQRLRSVRPGGRGRRAGRGAGRRGASQRARRPGPRSEKQVDVTGVDPTTIAASTTSTWVDGLGRGALAELGGDGAIVTEGFADDHDLAVGSRFAIETPTGDTLNVVVRGIYDAAGPRSDARPGHASRQRPSTPPSRRPRNLFTFVNVSGGESERRRPPSRARSPDSPMRSCTRRPASSEPDEGRLDRSCSCSTSCSASPWWSASSGW